jgi:hypothetical protein
MILKERQSPSCGSASATHVGPMNGSKDQSDQTSLLPRRWQDAISNPIRNVRHRVYTRKSRVHRRMFEPQGQPRIQPVTHPALSDNKTGTVDLVPRLWLTVGTGMPILHYSLSRGNNAHQRYILVRNPDLRLGSLEPGPLINTFLA